MTHRLRRANRAIGVWITELDPNEEGPRAERIIEPERLSVAQIVAVDRRLERNVAGHRNPELRAVFDALLPGATQAGVWLRHHRAGELVTIELAVCSMAIALRSASSG